MPSLTRKFIKGRPYYYVRHCQRIDGKPKIIKTMPTVKPNSLKSGG